MMDIERAVEAVKAGSIVGMPTDTVYGVGADPRRPLAVQALFDLKGRPVDKPVGLLGASLDALRSLIVVGEEAVELAARFWPGPLTLVVESAVPLPAWVGDHVRRTVAVRVPNHPVALEFLAVTGPLAVTSANRTGEPPAVSDIEARALLGDAVAVYLPGVCPGGTSSTVVDVTVDPPKMLREGPADIGS